MTARPVVIALAVALLSALAVPHQAVAADPPPACSLRAIAEGTCGDGTLARWQEPPAPAPAPVPARRRDSLRHGALIGGAIGLALGLFTAGIADCPGEDQREPCPLARAGGVALSTAVWAGIGTGIDALITERVPVPAAPGASGPAGRDAAPPLRPSLTMRVRW